MFTYVPIPQDIIPLDILAYSFIYAHSSLFNLQPLPHGPTQGVFWHTIQPFPPH